MIVVRIFSTLMDAQLAKLQLREAGIGCDILDEAIASSFPAAAFADGVRLAVADEDEASAREVLGLPGQQDKLPSAKPKKGVPVWAFVIVAAAMIVLAIKADDNAKGSTPQGVVERDRNGDGRADVRQESSDGGHTLTIYADNNFDGKWDAKDVYRDFVIVSSEEDSDFDGAFDWKTEYKDGLPVTSECRKAGQGPVLVRRTFRQGILESAFVDSDGDGKWDYRAEYDAYGRETGRISLK
jgi:hypothetical protein